MIGDLHLDIHGWDFNFKEDYTIQCSCVEIEFFNQQFVYNQNFILWKINRIINSSVQ